MKTAIITGASKGIGLAAARWFLDNGYRVINFSRSPAPDARVENEALDLTVADAEDRVNERIASLVDASHPICVVHNAAVMTNDTAGATASADFEAVLRLNVVAPHILNQALIPRMQAGSSVIYIGSTLAEKAVPGTYSYVVSKHALIGMMRATCQDLAGTGIHTCCVCPGFTDTEMLRVHIGEDASVLASIAGMSTFNRLIDSDEIAATIGFAATNPVINGAVLHANLGQVEH
jgi:3-oxoacyl-[acyl-carrier protein] reductase